MNRIPTIVTDHTSAISAIFTQTMTMIDLAKAMQEKHTDPGLASKQLHLSYIETNICALFAAICADLDSAGEEARNVQSEIAQCAKQYHMALTDICSAHDLTTQICQADEDMRETYTHEAAVLRHIEEYSIHLNQFMMQAVEAISLCGQMISEMMVRDIKAIEQ